MIRNTLNRYIGGRYLQTYNFNLETDRNTRINCEIEKGIGYKQNKHTCMRNQRGTNRMLYILHSSVKVYYYGNIKADSNVHNTMHLLLQKIYVKLFYHHDGINLILHETA